MRKLLIERNYRGFMNSSPVTNEAKRGPLKRVLLALACTLFTTVSFAECARTLPVKQEYKQSQSVLIVTVESARRVPQSWDAFDGTSFTVHVDQKVKGKQSGEITVFSEHSDDAFNLKIGSQYLLFLSDNYQHWQVNKCGNSGEMGDEAPVIKQIAHILGDD